MKKILLGSVSLLVLFFTVNISASPVFSKDKIKKVKLSNFKNKAESLVGKTIKLEGLVDHVCEHDGKKLFLVEENSDARVKIVPNESMAAFTQDLIGETIEVVGVVKEFRVDEDYLTEMEEKIKAESREESEVHMGDGEHNGNKEEHNMEDQMEQVNKLRKKLKASKKGYLSYFSVEASSYKVLK